MLSVDVPGVCCAKLAKGSHCNCFCLSVCLSVCLFVCFTTYLNATSLQQTCHSIKWTSDWIKNNTIPCSMHMLLSRGSRSCLLTFYSVWNLTFLHSVIPPFCLSENITILHALALHYLPALYPLLLIIGTYILIELHDRTLEYLCGCGGLFRRLALFQGSLRWNPNASIVNTFATFLRLAYTTKSL